MGKHTKEKKNLNVPAQLKHKLKWKYFLLLKTQTESPSKWPFTIFPICLCLNCVGLKASIIHFLLPKVNLCKVGKLKETKNPFQPLADPTYQLPAKSPLLIYHLISFRLNIYIVPAAEHTVGGSIHISYLCLCIIKPSEPHTLYIQFPQKLQIAYQTWSLSIKDLRSYKDLNYNVHFASFIFITL